MAIQNLEYWYDGQQRRFLEQLVRAFSGFQYQPGYKNGVLQPLRMVPCRMASTSHMVASIMRNQSENTLLSVPMITVYQNGLAGRADAIQYPGFIDSLQVSERAIVNGEYTGDRGQRYTVDRIMPRPFQMNVQVDIWTSNLDQKYQLLEQILTVIYPSFDVQNSQNPIDWTALTTVYCEDITLSSRSMPAGSSDEIDVATINLRLPIWLSPPAKVKRQKIIEQIIANIYDGAALPTSAFGSFTDGEGEIVDAALMARTITTPGDYHVAVEGENITLLNQRGQTGGPGLPSWETLLGLYGAFQPAISAIHLLTTEDPEGPYVSGTLQLDPSAPDNLIWQVDPTTLPQNTQAAVNAIIDPMRTYPGAGLPTAVEGVRYLIVSDIGPSQAWPGLTAYVNDIVQFTNGGWLVSFASRTTPALQYVLNSHTGRQLRWTGKEWLMSIDGTYSPGYWRLLL